MMKHEDMDELFRRLLSGVAVRADAKPDAIDQSRQLVSAFNNIKDPRLRQELVLLIEIVSQMPEVLQRKRDRWLNGAFAQLH